MRTGLRLIGFLALLAESVCQFFACMRERARESPTVIVPGTLV
jgi:hypothetical protein